MPTFTDPESIEWYRYPVLAENPHGKQWIKRDNHRQPVIPMSSIHRSSTNRDEKESVE